MSSKHCVNVNGAKSDWAPSGILQASVIKPCLVLVFINDLLEATHLLTQMFVDDTKVYKLIRNQQDQQQLQEDINSLVDWVYTLQFSFNIKKCKVLHIGRKYLLYQYSMMSDELVITLDEMVLKFGCNCES